MLEQLQRVEKIDLTAAAPFFHNLLMKCSRSSRSSLRLVLSKWIFVNDFSHCCANNNGKLGTKELRKSSLKKRLLLLGSLTDNLSGQRA